MPESKGRALGVTLYCQYTGLLRGQLEGHEIILVAIELSFPYKASLLFLVIN